MSDTVPTHDVRVLYWIGGVATVGLALAGFFTSRSVTVEVIESDDAQRKFADIRDRLPRTEPILHVNELGVVTRHEVPAAGKTPQATRLYVVAYLAPERRLVRADVPFWFLKMKGPGVNMHFVTPDLTWSAWASPPLTWRSMGVCMLLDETRAAGDRLLAWTQ